jgi:hypothetical protein
MGVAFLASLGFFRHAQLVFFAILCSVIMRRDARIALYGPQGPDTKRNIMKKILHAAAIMSLLGLSACASIDPVQTPRAAELDAPPAPLQSRAITGSRIPAKTTEKMVYAIGGQDYSDYMRSKMLPGPKQ